MYFNSQINLNSGKIYVDSSKVYWNLRKRIIKFLNSDKFLLNLSSTQNLGVCDTLP